MTTKLTVEEFESRLSELTTIGEPTIFGTPFATITIFDFSGRPFYDKFDRNGFRITRNSVLPFQPGHIINGQYSTTDKKGTFVTYELKPISFAYYWTRIAPILFFIFVNYILFYFLPTFEWTLLFVFYSFVAFATFTALKLEGSRREDWKTGFGKNSGLNTNHRQSVYGISGPLTELGDKLLLSKTSTLLS